MKTLKPSTLLITTVLSLLMTPVSSQSLREQAELQEKERIQNWQIAKQAEMQEQKRAALIKKDGFVIGCNTLIGYQFYNFYDGKVYELFPWKTSSYADALLSTKPISFSLTGKIATWTDDSGSNYEANFNNLTVYTKRSKSSSIEIEKCILIQRGKQ